jgi:hypothetical protein
MRKAKKAAWRDQLRSPVGSNGKAPFPQSQEDEGLQFDIGGDGHGLNSLS